MSYLYQQSGKNVSLAAGSCLTAPIICGSTCVQSAQILSTKVSVGSLNTSYDLYNNGTTYLNGAVTIDDTVTAHRFKSSCRLWNTSSLASNNFFADSGESGGDGFAIGQGTGILDIWVKDDSVSELRSVFRAKNQGNCIVIGRGCSSNDNANIPVYVCRCVQSPVLCGSTCVYSNCLYVNNAQIDACLTITGSKILKTGGYNKPGIQMTGTGNYSFCDINIFLKNTNAANSAIFSDYEPHGEWGLFHDNQADAFYITAGSSCHNVGSFNMKNCAGTVRTAYIKQKFVQGNGTAEIGGSLSVSPDCSNNYNGMALGCTYTNIGGWHTQLSMYGASHVVARWNHSHGTDSANNAQSNCIYAHTGTPFVMMSSGNIRLCGQDTVCISGKGVACTCFQTPILCAPTCVCSPKVCASTCVHTGDLCLTEDYTGDMSNGIQLGRANGRPQAAWGESGERTGRIEIGLPTKNGEGGSVHHGMVHVAVDVYEYDSNNVSTFIVGGHNWNCRWYNCGAHITGGCTNKSIKLAYHSCGGTNNGRYVILIGECDSTWQYGSVHVRSITNGLYYVNNMNVGTPWYLKRVTCADSYYHCTSADLRSGSKSQAAYQCATVCVHTPRVCGTSCVKSACLHSTGNICGSEFCSGSWFRNANSGQGLYNVGTGFHFYSTATNNVRVYSANANNIGITGYTCGAGRGCLNFNCDNQIRLVDSGGNTRFIINSSTDIRLCNTTCLHCNIYVGGRIFACNQTESINFKGARGCFTNQYMHLYNKVGIGHPSGWGCGETNTPDKGLSTYGTACIGYGTTASLSHLKVAGGVSTLGSRGLYSETNANCFYPDAAGTWNLQSASGQTHSSLRFRRGDGTIDGYVYSSTGGYIGILDSASYWAYGHQTNACHWWNISNNTHMKMCGNCLCHCHTICAQHCLRANNVEGVTCVHSPVVCGTSCVQSCRYELRWRNISVGGDYDKFYPITFTAKGGYNSEDILEISQDNVHQPSSSCGAMYLKLGFNITGWGHISNHYIVHKYATGGTNTLVSKVRHVDHSTCRVGVWLRGGLTYHYRSREGTIACDVTGSSTACCLSYDNSNNAYDVYVQYTSSVEDLNFGNAGGCNAGTKYLTHHCSNGGAVVMTSANLQSAMCCGCYVNKICFGNCSNINNLQLTTGCVIANSCVQTPYVLATNCVHACCGIVFSNTNWSGEKTKIQAHACNLYFQNYNTGHFIFRNCGTCTVASLNQSGCFTAGACVVTPVVLATNCVHACCGIVFTHSSWSGEKTKIQAHSNHLYFQNGTAGGCMFFRNSAGSNVMHLNCNGCLYLSNCINSNTICSRCGITGCCYVRTPGYLQFGSGVFPWSTSQSCVSYATGDAAGTGWLCPLLLCRCGGVVINGGSNNTSNDAALYICQTNNNDWALRVMNNTNSATEYGIKVEMGASATYGYDAIFGGTRKFTVSYNCMCHSGKICAGECVSAARVCAGTCVRSGVVCATSGFYGDGSNLTNIPGGNPDYYCAESNRIRIGRCNMMNIGTTQNYSLGSCIMTCVQSACARNNIAIGHDIANYTSAAANGLCYNTFIGALMARKGCCNLQNNIVIGYQAGYHMGHASSNAAQQNVVIGSYAGSSYSGTFTGCENTFIGTGSGYAMTTGCKNTGVGKHAGKCNTTGKCNVFLGFCSGSGHTTGTGYSYIGARNGCCVILCGNTSVCGSLSKSSGCFKIAHPNPTKRDSYDLVHSFVESPTEGDNIYRYTTETTSCRSVIELPDYYSYLNKNDQVWVSANKHFGVGYGEVTEDQKCLVVCSCCDGIYNVLLIGTRKDNDAVRNWNGPEIKLKHPDRDIVDR